MDIRPIRNEKDYQEAIEELERLWGSEPGTDRLLLHNADQFNRAIIAVADWTERRASAEASLDHWWWYLDVLIGVPQYLPAGS